MRPRFSMQLGSALVCGLFQPVNASSDSGSVSDPAKILIFFLALLAIGTLAKCLRQRHRNRVHHAQVAPQAAHVADRNDNVAINVAYNAIARLYAPHPSIAIARAAAVRAAIAVARAEAVEVEARPFSNDLGPQSPPSAPATFEVDPALGAGILRLR